MRGTPVPAGGAEVDEDGPVVALLAPLPATVVGDRWPQVTVHTPDPELGPEAAAAAACAGAEVVVADWSGRHRVAGAALDALGERCRLVQVPAAGLDAVDAAGLHARGIPLASCAGLNDVAVAEWCVWAVLDALKQTSWADRALRDGRFEQLGHARFELAGRRVGIVGLGSIGAAVARRLAGFDVEVVHHSRRPRTAAEEATLGVRGVPLDELVATADVVVLACALTDETRGLFDADRLARCKHGAVLVNAARGEVVDEVALARAVDEGRLHAAATDVFSTEPPPAGHPLVGHERITATPHLAGASAESVGRIFGRVFANLDAVLTGTGEVVGLVAPPR
ncbi:3-phosphoglycerate dehydrogenase [Nitriliruptoraceae bacterium ZYF776]|nr:3-phosphoglycerate dehydrogenase [Profundirhabdus halotolerans]